MDDKTAPKKRKREASKDTGCTIVTSHETSGLGPILTSFPALQPPINTKFRAYHAQRGANLAIDDQHQPTLLMGESEVVEYRGTIERGPSDQSHSCQYLVGVHDVATHTIRLYRAPMYTMDRDVKRLKSLAPVAVSTFQRLQARNHLGEIFGSKKAVKAIRAAERNKVDVSAMQGVVGYIQETIDSGTSALPSEDQAKMAIQENRPIPPINVQATTPLEVYSLHDLAPESELAAISTAPFLAADDHEHRVGLLPYKASTWINGYLRRLFQAERPSKSSLKQLIFICHMLSFRSAAGQLKFGDKDGLARRMPKTPSVIIEGLLSRFTETSRGGSKPVVTNDTETRLLTHLFALCLRLENFTMVTGTLAGDISMPMDKVNTLFKTLGCTITNMTTTERKAAGLSTADAKEQKRAALKLPLVFPKAKSSATRGR